MSIKFNDAEKIYGGFSDATPVKITPQVDSDLAAGLGLGIIGLGLAAGLAAAMDEIDADDRALREARRRADEARRDAERRRREEEAEIKRRAEAAALRARLAAMDELGYGLTESDLSRALVKFSMQEKNRDSQKMMTTTLAVLFLLREQGSVFTRADDDTYSHIIVFTGHDRYGDETRVSLSWTGTIEIRCYGAAISRYATARTAYPRYESLVAGHKKDLFSAVVRRASN